MRSLVWIAACLLGSAPAVAGPLSSTLHVPAAHCDDRAALEERILQRLAPEVQPGAEVAYWVRFEPASRGVLATIDANVDGQRHWSRQLRGASCDDVADAVAVIIAVDVERRARLDATSESPSSAVSEQPDEHEARARPLSQARRWALRMTAGPLATTALSSTPTAGVMLGGQLLASERAFGGIGLDMVALLPEEVHPNIHTNLYGGRLRWLSPAWPFSSDLRLRAAMGYGLALVRARGLELDQVRSASALRHVVSLSAGAEAHWGAWLTMFELGAEWAPAPDRFIVMSSSGEVVTRVELPALAAMAGIAAGFEW